MSKDEKKALQLFLATLEGSLQRNIRLLHDISLVLEV